MTWLSKSGNPTLVFIAILLLISGCISQPTAKITPPTLSDVYTVPIGGFEKTMVIVDPNYTFETDYIFYSRNWGPGEVKYTASGSSGSYGYEQLAIEPMQIHIIPSNFTAEPNHTYKSRLFLNTSDLPKDFFLPVDDQKGMYNVASINMNVSLQDKSANYGADRISLYHSFITLGGPPYDSLFLDNCSIQIKPGETRKITISFVHDPTGGLEEISYIPSKTSLNISIIPSKFVVKHFLKFPSIITVTANPSLISGEYQIDTTIEGVRAETLVHCNDTNSDFFTRKTLTQSNFSLNVSVM